MEPVPRLTLRSHNKLILLASWCISKRLSEPEKLDRLLPAPPRLETTKGCYRVKYFSSRSRIFVGGKFVKNGFNLRFNQIFC